MDDDARCDAHADTLICSDFVIVARSRKVRGRTRVHVSIVIKTRARFTCVSSRACNAFSLMRIAMSERRLARPDVAFDESGALAARRRKMAVRCRELGASSFSTS